MNQSADGEWRIGELDSNDPDPVGVRVRQMLPTVHPAFVLRTQRWMKVFKSDVARAARWFSGAYRWDDPVVTYHPDAATLHAFLSQPEPFFAYDTETDGIEPLTCNLRCLGVGTADGARVHVIGILGIDGATRFYPEAELARVTDVLRGFFSDRNIVKVSWNGGGYDTHVIRRWFGAPAFPELDGILIHRLVESELPHNLGFVGTLYADAPTYKQDREGKKLATDAESDEELHVYNARDVAVTARVINPLLAAAKMREQDHLIQTDHAIQRCCAGMKANGLYVDQARRAWRERMLIVGGEEHVDGKTIVHIGIRTLLGNLQRLSGRPKLNPGSTVQLRDLMFDAWKLDPVMDEEEKYTATGEPSTSDDVLRALLLLPDLDGGRREFVKQLRYYRQKQKLLGTYVAKIRYAEDDAEIGWDDEENDEERADRQKRANKKKGICDRATGRIYPGFNAHVAVTGRLSSSKPINAQNVVVALRDMIIPAPGNVFVGADADQIELRVAASLWKCKKYLDAFAVGADPHAMTAFMVFKDDFKNAKGVPPGEWRDGLFVPSDPEAKWKDDAKKKRDLSKRVAFGSLFGAGSETVHSVVTQTETANDDGTTALPYLKMSLPEIRKMHKDWLRGAHEFEVGWANTLEDWRRDGYLLDPVMKRRRDFLDGENPNEIWNFRVQCSAAGLITLAMLELVEEIPFGKWGPGTGLVCQVHDHLMVECPESEGARVARVLERCMNREHPALPGVRFTAKAAIARTWKDA
jgi:DNA polymerase I-like protein with 3'-5' exonuclease and polymerase domains